MLSTDPSYDNRTIASTLKMQIRTVQRAQGDENKVSGYGYVLWCREHHQYDLQQHQNKPDRCHPPSIRRAPTGVCGKGMLPVPDPYRGGD